MRAFLALSWEESNTRASALVERIHDGLIESGAPFRSNRLTEGLLLIDLSTNRDAEAIVKSGGPHICALFGTAFENHQSAGGYNVASEIKDDAAKEICESGGNALLKHYWGRYVGFVCTSNSTHIITEPTSSFPCFYTMVDNVVLIFSHLERWWELLKPRLTINQEFIRTLLAYDNIQNGETGFREIRELAGGRKLSLYRGRAVEDVLWDPRDIAADRIRCSPGTVQEALRHTVQSVVHAWARPYQSISVSLSGGLDSSIVMACLASAPSRPHVNAYHQSYSGDASELAFAEMSANGCARELIVAEMEPSIRVKSVEAHPLSARPDRAFVAQSLEAIFGHRLEELGEALFTGQGGDHLFLSTRTPLVFADYIRGRDSHYHFKQMLFWTAQLSRKSIWSVLAQSAPYAVGKESTSYFLEHFASRMTAVNKNAFKQPSLADRLPDWVVQPKGLPPAKFQQINQLFHMIHMRETLDQTGHREFVHPLISQPLLELSLRIPTYALLAGGRDRGTARLAFAGNVPSAILDRTTKAAASEFYSRYIQANAEILLRSLASGELANRELIDTEVLRSFMRNDAFRTARYGRMLLPYYAIEAWLSSWKRRLTECCNLSCRSPLSPH